MIVKRLLTRQQSDLSMRITAWSLLIAIYLILAGTVALAVWMIVVVVRDINGY